MADFQLQFIFEAFDAKRQRLREVQKQITEILEAAPGFKEINERLTAAKAEMKNLAELALSGDRSLVEEMDALKAEVEGENERLQAEAVAAALAGNKLEVKDRKGNVLVGDLNVKFKKAKDNPAQ